MTSFRSILFHLAGKNYTGSIWEFLEIFLPEKFKKSCGILRNFREIIIQLDF